MSTLVSKNTGMANAERLTRAPRIMVNHGEGSLLTTLSLPDRNDPKITAMTGTTTPSNDGLVSSLVRIIRLVEILGCSREASSLLLYVEV